MGEISQAERDTFGPMFAKFMQGFEGMKQTNEAAHTKMMEDWGKEMAGDAEVKAKSDDIKAQSF